MEKWQKPAKLRVGRTALHEAAMVGDLKKVKKELVSGAVDEKQYGKNKKKSSSLPPLDTGDLHGMPAYHLACSKGHTDCVKELVKAKASLDLQTEVRATVAYGVVVRAG